MIEDIRSVGQFDTTPDRACIGFFIFGVITVVYIAVLLIRAGRIEDEVAEIKRDYLPRDKALEWMGPHMRIIVSDATRELNRSITGHLATAGERNAQSIATMSITNNQHRASVKKEIDAIRSEFKTASDNWIQLGYLVMGHHEWIDKHSEAADPVAPEPEDPLRPEDV